VLRGEPGIGKSSLLAFAADQAGDMPLLRATGVQTEVALPFAALHELLYPVLNRLQVLPAPQATALGGAFGSAPGRGDDRFLVAVAVLSLLAEVAGDTGMLCLVDDAQWVDQASSEALVFAARRLHAEGVVMLFAARDGEPQEFRAPGLPERRLTGLEPHAACTLLQEIAPELAVGVQGQLVERTGGNPLALLELPPLLSTGQKDGSEPLPEPLPAGHSLELIFAERVSRLPDDTQLLLLVAATEETGDLATALRAAKLVGPAPEALEAAERDGLISAEGGRLLFRHPLVRSAIYLHATFAQQQAAHLAVAAVLDPVGDVDRLAWHQAAATLGPNAEVAVALERSADRARLRGGVVAAADALDRAGQLTADGALRGRRWLTAAENAWQAGQRLRAAALLEAAQPLLVRHLDEARALQLGGLIEMRCGMPERAYRLLVASAAAFSSVDSHAALGTLVYAGEVAAFIGDPAMAAEVGRLALDVPQSQETEDTLMVGLLAGLAAVLTGDAPAGIRMLRDVVAGAESFDGAEQLLWAGRAALYVGDLGAARTLYLRGAEHARTSGAVGMLATMLDRVAWAGAIAGCPADAETAANEGLRLSRELGLDAGVALGALAVVGAIRGDEPACRSVAESAHELARARHLPIVAASAEWALGLLELGLGRPEEAFSRLNGITASGANSHAGILLWALPDLVEAAARAGHAEACGPSLSRFEQWALGTGLPVPAAAVARCRGLLSDGDDAIGHFTAALQHDRGAERPFERARTELALGEALRRERRRIESRAHLRNALGVFERLGALPWAERARGELRATGETARKRDSSTLDHLTAQELQIARFARDGSSNPEIAAKLFLSRRTVEYHLGKVYTKLDVTSRLDLMRMDLENR
jgi:DNA-binding CsgD family transcriptional regulator